MTELFKGVHQLETELSGEKVKFPVFYYDASCIITLFVARMKKLKSLMPKKEYHPLPFFPGTGLIAVTAFEYRNTDIRPYNELSISVLVSYKSRPLIPFWDSLKSLLTGEFHTYIVHLPVTTKIALDGGVVVYNYPKFLSQIHFAQTENVISVELKEKDPGQDILRLRARKIPANHSRLFRITTYPVKEGFAQRAEVLLNAAKYGVSFSPGAASLELEEGHPIGRELSGLLISRKAVYTQYIPDFQAILYGPARLE